jgi:acetyltransferase-like isoleucine patch superfamily enzyme
MKNYRKLTGDEILRLKNQSCVADDWGQVMVDEHFTTGYVHHTRFSGEVKLGVFHAEFTLPGGIKKHSGLRHVTLHNVTLGDNCCIENIQNYIANYEIGDHTFIENVGIILVDGVTKFGNGVEAAVLNETGGREVLISDKLSAQQAYIMALYRHRPELIRRMKEITDYYSNKYASHVGRIGSYVMIINTGSVKNIKVGDHCHIEGACRLENGSINSNEVAPVHVGYNVICEDFILSSGSYVDDGTVLSRCFVGQACRLGHNYSASDSLFFSNCQGENGEACAIFAGPFTVTHHKSTLLIAGMFSFMNAGSGSNQSNHMYKLGPIHQGTMERGAKTTSDSYILWPARVGAFSLVMGRHVNHADTSNLPFSYLIEQGNTTYLIPGVNLRSVGTIRDAQKWPKRDKRTDPNRLDCINYNLLSPYTIQKMFKGCAILKELRRVSGETSEIYSYQSAKIKNSSLNKGLKFYETAIHKFLGNSIIKRLEGIEFRSDEDIRQRLKPDTEIGTGEWVDISGLIAPKSEVEKLLCGIESGEINRLRCINERFEIMHKNYYTYEWTWAYHKIKEFYGLAPETITAKDITDIVNAWKDAVIGLDRLIYEDARKEFSLSSMTGFGADGSRNEMKQDFGQVRGDFESNPFVTAVLKHIEVKTALGDELIRRMERVRFI